MLLPRKLQTNPSPKQNNLSTGSHGEDIAVKYLTHKGYRIIDRNFRAPYGEIDIVATRPTGVLSFIEVKCRMGDRLGKPYELVTSEKRRRLSKVIQLYLLKNKLMQSKLAFEVISIILKIDRTVEKIQHFENVEMNI